MVHCCTIVIISPVNFIRMIITLAGRVAIHFYMGITVIPDGRQRRSDGVIKFRQETGGERGITNYLHVVCPPGRAAHVQNRSRRFCRTIGFESCSSLFASLNTGDCWNPPCLNWRRERDSNPRWAYDPYALSRGAPSTSSAISPEI